MAEATSPGRLTLPAVAAPIPRARPGVWARFRRHRLALVGASILAVLVLVAVLLILGFPGTAFVRGQLACRFCRQRELGCPAEQLFDRGRAK